MQYILLIVYLSEKLIAFNNQSFKYYFIYIANKFIYIREKINETNK